MPSKKNKRLSQAFRGRQGGSRGGSRNFSSILPQILNGDVFTMRDEARNTASHRTLAGQVGQLRRQPVPFVSAGFTEPLKDLPVALPGSHVSTSAVQESLAADIAAVQNEALPVGSTHDSGATSAVDQDEEPASTGEDKAQEAPPKITSLVEAATSESVASETAFFFDLKGDKKLAEHKDTNRHAPASASDTDSSEDIILFKGRANLTRAGLKHRQVAKTAAIAGAINAVEDNRDVVPAAPENAASSASLISGPRASSPGSQNTQEQGHLLFQQEEIEIEQDDEALIIADYIANMAQDSDSDGPDLQAFSHSRELGGDDTAFGLALDDGSESDAGSLLDEEDANIDPEARSDQQDEEVDENEDEALAMLLSKQEELGLGSDELILFSGSYTGNLARSRTKTDSPGSRKASKISHMLKTKYTSATAVAEAFDTLDLAEWDKFPAPSASGHRTSQMPTFDVSDSELEAKMQAAWQNDRARKKGRKMEREELRARGLLDKSTNPDDMRVKYQVGMTLEDIKEELKVFLLSTDQTLTFPPMDKHARKMLHELANKFKIKSQSTGSGDQRRPTLYRTKQTFVYRESESHTATKLIETAAARIGRKFFHRPDAGGKQGHGSRSTAGARSGGKAVTYREGEIVGATAPELGQENKGHAMLEKMGWSKGMALGATENQGILEPVAQVIKRSKAGLG